MRLILLFLALAAGCRTIEPIPVRHDIPVPVLNSKTQTEVPQPATKSFWNFVLVVGAACGLVGVAAVISQHKKT
jgi:hypothetical protein